MWIRQASLIALFAASLGLLKADCPPPPPPLPTPEIVLTSATVNGKAIKTKGTYKVGPLKYEGITVFIVPKAGGYVIDAKLTKQPATGNWPDTGTLDKTVSYKGTYKAYAVLTLSDPNDSKQKTFYGSSISADLTVTDGDTLPTNYISWAANSPTTGMGSITGQGTYTIPMGSAARTVSLWV